ncbi:uncharacterized protein LOC125229847 [Leguminivora glycinivorella]|uniref:uncharacterized protein LOC125229847 n=1 Tax=Leguminivora glycinivorella TaxID=1035111 RepID=UPI00200D7741|nr:uncharacterized protein LOC125229847 [Leguminivora glycinivorella]
MDKTSKNNLIKTNKNTTTSLDETAQAEALRRAKPIKSGTAKEEPSKPERPLKAGVPSGIPAQVADPETKEPPKAGPSSSKPPTAESGTLAEPSKQVIDPGWEIRCKPRGKPAQTEHEPPRNKLSQRQRQRLRKRREAASRTSETKQQDEDSTVAKQTQAKKPEGKAKRARLDETISPRGDHKKQRMDASSGTANQPSSYAAAAAADLTVAITNDRTGRLSQQDAVEVEKKIGDAIFQAAIETDLDTVAEAPAFSGKPSFVDGYLKLWCQDANTKAWLTKWLESATLQNGDRLVGKREDEMVRNTRCGILIPALEENLTKIGRVLNFQNPWALVRKWTLHQAIPLKKRACTLLLVGIPEDVVPVVLEKGRRLNYLCGTVYIRFQHSGGRFRDSPPEKTTAHEEEKARGEDNQLDSTATANTPSAMETDSAEHQTVDIEESVLLESEDEDGLPKGISLLDLKGRAAEESSSSAAFPM